MSRARELAKVGGKNQQVVAGLSSHVGVSTFASDVYMYSNLEVTGTTTFNGGTLTLGDANTDNIVFGGEVDSHIIPDDDGTYNLGSATKEWNNIFIDGTANIDALLADTAKIGDLTDNRVVIAGTSGELEDSGNLTFDGSILTTTNVVVTGDTDLGNATSDTITATGRFDSDIVPSTDNARDLGASGLEFKDLYLDGTANIDSLVADTADINGGTVDGAAINSTTIGASSPSTGAFTTLSANGNVDLGDATSDTITATGRFDSDLTPSTDGARDLGASGLEWQDLFIDGTAKIDTLTVDENATVAGTLDVNSSKLTVGVGLTDVIVRGDMRVTGIMSVGNGTVTIDETTVKTGTSNLHNVGIEIAGVNTLGADTPIGENATIFNNGNATFAGQVTAATLDISGNIDIDGTTNLDAVDIDGAVDMASNLTLAGNADFNGNLDVDGTSNLDAVDIDGAVDMASSLTLAGNADFNGDLDVDGTTNLDVVDIDGAVDMASNLTLAGDADFNGSLDVDGTTNLDATNVVGALGVTGSATVDNLSLDGNTVTTSSGNLTIDSAGGTTTINDACVISGNLTVNGTTTTINSTTVSIDDKNFQVATGAADDAAADGAGFTVDSGDGDKTWNFEATGDNWGSSENINLASGKVLKVNNSEVLSASALSSNITVPGSTINIDGTTDIGAAIVDADEILIDDGGGGTNRRSDMSRVKTYIYGATSGDATASSSGAITLAASGVSANTYGSATAIPIITVDAKGRITTASTTAVDSTLIATLNTSVATTDTGSNGTITGTCDGTTVYVATSGQVDITGNLDVSSGVDVSGNITVTGTVDGRDVASDGSKLDGIESGATADQTASEILTLIKTVDGSGSGLDADTLDGISSASFLRSDTSDTFSGTLTVSGNILPNANGTRDLGASGTRWANVYSSDLDLSNEAKGGNTIDGSWGSYLIEEGESNLYLTNRRSGKKYKFMLEEV